jgi:predicted naringenin-chalcone synthase
MSQSLLAPERNPIDELHRKHWRLTDFIPIAPRYRTPQSQLLQWLAEAHRIDPALFSRFGASSDQIAWRGHELSDFAHREWNDMRLFSTTGSNLSAKTGFFSERVDDLFRRLYPPNALKPDAIVHVTCTGYTSPSGAQKIISERSWGRSTEALHAYHMGCYAAHPAIRMAMGFARLANQTPGRMDIVHTELCSLHFDPKDHRPEQLVIQSLFADGFIRYTATSDESNRDGPSLEILAMRDEIVPDSAGAMGWATGSLHFAMTLSREVPSLLAAQLPRFVDRLLLEARMNSLERSRLIFAVHPGGPRIIDLAEKILGLSPHQTAASRFVLREHGNMSSATLPHIWAKIVNDPDIPDGAVIVSLGAGPGLTLSGAIFQKGTVPR